MLKLRSNQMFNPVSRNSTQLQESDNANQILPKIKIADATILCHLLKPIFEARIRWLEKTSKSEIEREISISDLGCGEGQMILTLLKLLSENLKSFLELRISIYAYDEKEDMIKKYQENFAVVKKNSDSYLKYTSIKRAEVQKIQDLNFPSSDIFLASHSFYYCREAWDTSPYNNNKTIPFSNHLLTKLLAALKENGAICVILQSNENTAIKSKQKDIVDQQESVFVANHENFEDVMYPLKNQFDQDVAKISKNSERNTFTNAQIFAECMQKYREEWTKNHASELEIISGQSIAVIELGEINFKLNEKNQKYEQSEAVTALLNFYTRNLYTRFDSEAQKKLLNFIQTHCIRSDGSMVMCHLNRAFLICPKEKIANEELLVNQSMEKPSGFIK